MKHGLLAAVTVALVAAATVAVAAPDFAALNVQAYSPAKPAPEFALPDLGGKTVRLADFKGKTLLLFFWATW